MLPRLREWGPHQLHVLFPSRYIFNLWSYKVLIFNRPWPTLKISFPPVSEAIFQERFSSEFWGSYRLKDSGNGWEPKEWRVVLRKSILPTPRASISFSGESLMRLEIQGLQEHPRGATPRIPYFVISRTLYRLEWISSNRLPGILQRFGNKSPSFVAVTSIHPFPPPGGQPDTKDVTRYLPQGPAAPRASEMPFIWNTVFLFPFLSIWYIFCILRHNRIDSGVPIRFVIAKNVALKRKKQTNSLQLGNLFHQSPNIFLHFRKFVFECAENFVSLIPREPLDRFGWNSEKNSSGNFSTFSKKINKQNIRICTTRLSFIWIIFCSEENNGSELWEILRIH